MKRVILLTILALLMVACKTKKVIKDNEVVKEVVKEISVNDSVKNVSKIQEKEVVSKKENTEQKKESETEITVKGKVETGKPLEIYKIENGDTLQAFKVTGNAEVSIKSKGVYSMQVKQDSKTESLTEKLKEFSKNIVQENKIKERVSEMKKRTQKVNTKTGTFWSFGLIGIFGVVALLIIGIIIYLKIKQ